MEHSESAEEQHLGKRLIAKGWKQGVLLPALTFGVAYDPEAPGSELAEGTATRLQGRSDIPSHALAIAYTGKPNSKLVVISQTCDIARSPNIEKTVLAMRVDIVRNQEVLDKAKGSVRQFVLNEELGYLVDARTIATIEKATLEGFDPIPGAPNSAVERSFSRWLAARFMRASHPDSFIAGVRRPIEELLESLRSSSPAQADLLRACDLRVFPPSTSTPPFEANLIVVMPRSITEGQIAAVLSCIPLLKEVLIAPAVSKSEIWVVKAEELSADDLLETDNIRSLD